MNNASPQVELARLALKTLSPAECESLLREHLPQEPQPPASLRLFRMGDAARETGLSRSTLWRAIRDGRLKTVEVRRGSHRMAEAELRRFVEGR
jgi:predicted DNA-binding transcriptional regulator AlpA